MTWPPHVAGLLRDIDNGHDELLGILSDALEDIGEENLARGLRLVVECGYVPVAGSPSGNIGCTFFRDKDEWCPHWLPGRFDLLNADERNNDWKWWIDRSRCYLELARVLSEEKS